MQSVLHDAAPDLAFFGEETGGERADVGWFVDPLDGTANFVHGFPVVGVSVALVADGVPVVAVVQAPMLGDVYSACLGRGAFLNDEPIRVSARRPERAICATGFPFRAKRQRLPEYVPVFERAMLTFEDLRRAGAASLDLAWTSAGVYDGYFEQNLGTWDVAAGALLVREAGGVVTDWQGRRPGVAAVGRHRRRAARRARPAPRGDRGRRLTRVRRCAGSAPRRRRARCTPRR